MAPVDNHQIAKYLTELYDFISVLYFYLLLRKVITTADWANLGRTLTEWTGSSGTRSEHWSRHHYPAWWGEIWPRTFLLRTLRFVGLKTWWAHRTLRPKVWAGRHTARGRHLTWFWGPAIVRIKRKVFMGFDYPILAEHAWAAIRDDGRLQNSRFFLSILVSSVAQEPHTSSPVSLSVLLFMEGKRHKEPSSLQIKVQF